MKLASQMRKEGIRNLVPLPRNKLYLKVHLHPSTRSLRSLAQDERCLFTLSKSRCFLSGRIEGRCALLLRNSLVQIQDYLIAAALATHCVFGRWTIHCLAISFPNSSRTPPAIALPPRSLPWVHSPYSLPGSQCLRCRGAPTCSRR